MELTKPRGRADETDETPQAAYSAGRSYRLGRAAEAGKGAPDGWVAVVKPGRMLFEMHGVSEELAREAMRLAAHKLPIATKFITRASEAAAVEKETVHAE